MLIEATTPLVIRLRSGEVRLLPGQPMRLSKEEGEKLLLKAPGKVRCLEPEPPLQPGWLVAYRDPTDQLRGGCDERLAGTVQECRWTESDWVVLLTNGDVLPLALIRSVGQTDAFGNVVAAWTVREHGVDGKRA